MLRALVACALAAGTLAVQRQRSFPDTWLVGTIGGGLRVHMFIGEPGAPKKSGLWGTYFYDAHWEPIPLEGAVLPTGDYEFWEGDPSTPPDARARFTLHFGSVVTGTWRDGTRTLPIRLTRTAQPAPFKDAIRHARRFADPRWPFTFKYPDGWMLRVDDTDLLLRSPDPEDMLYQNELACQRGHGVPAPPPPGEPPRPFAETSSFYRTASGWVVADGNLMQDCQDRDSDCAHASVRQSGNLIIVSADVGYRAYTVWGYAGAAERSEYLILRGDDWVSCADRLIYDEGRWIEPADFSRR